MRSSLTLSLVVAVALAGCHLPSGLEALGFACGSTADCGGSASLACAAGVCVARGEDGGGEPPGIPADLPFPVRVATYESEYPYAWKNGTAFHPTRGQYGLEDSGLLAAHLADFHYAHIDVALASWWGSGKDSDVAFDWILSNAAADSTRWAVEYLAEASTPLDTRNAGFLLRDIHLKFGSNARYWHIGGRNVVYVRTAYAQDPCEVASRYVQGNLDSKSTAYLILRAKAGKVPTCALTPDAWVLDDDGQALQKTQTIVSLSAGAQTDTSPATLVRDPVRYAANLKVNLDGGMQMQWLTSFNQWPDGTAVEPATEWASDSGHGTYLDLLHDAPVR